jgi:hypothetical protein
MYKCAGQATYIDDVVSLLNGALGVEAERGVNFCGDLARDDFKDLRTELDEEVVESSIDLSVDVATLSQL